MRYYILMLIIFLCLCWKKTQGQTPQDCYDYLKKIECKQPVIVTAQACLETGWFKSYGCKVRKNLFGLGGSNQMSFPTWEASCKYYKDFIQNRYKGEPYYEFLERIGYASDPDYINKLKQIGSKLVETLDL